MPCLSSASRRWISYSLSPKRRLERLPKLFADMIAPCQMLKLSSVKPSEEDVVVRRPFAGQWTVAAFCECHPEHSRRFASRSGLRSRRPPLSCFHIVRLQGILAGDSLGPPGTCDQVAIF